MHLLLIEDDRELVNVLQRGFGDEGIHVTAARDFETGRHQAQAGGFDVVVLDVMLPGGSGFELCRQIRAEGVSTPVLMLTALAAVDDRVNGLEGGADDYLTKPFAFRELLARVRVLARRPAGPPACPRIRSTSRICTWTCAAAASRAPGGRSG